MVGDPLIRRGHTKVVGRIPISTFGALSLGWQPAKIESASQACVHNGVGDRSLSNSQNDCEPRHGKPQRGQTQECPWRDRGGGRSNSY